MTQAEFDELPGLLTRRVFKEATGLKDSDIDELRRAGRLSLFSRPARKARRKEKAGKRLVKCKYYKWQAAELAGWKI